MNILYIVALFACVSLRNALAKSNYEEVNLIENDGYWGPLLEDWATSKSTNHRQGRVMLIPIAHNSVEAEDKVSNISKEINGNNGKIINNIKSPTGFGQISQTDMYLLSAIEKLVYKVDFLEKRLRRVEEMLYYSVAGNRIDTDKCGANFTRIGNECYHFNSATGREFDWKQASKKCKTIGGFLTEMETIKENQDLISFILATQHLRGRDFWVGGLNPGLLWIWTNSARPVATSSQNNKENLLPAVKDEGRCLRLAYDSALRSYNYKGTDCSIRYNFICEATPNKASNEIQRLGKSRNIFSD